MAEKEAMTAPAPISGARAVDVVLRDGSTVHVRPVTASDLDAMRAFLAHLSLDSRRLRYFSAGANVDSAAAAAVDVGAPGTYGIVATHGDGRGGAHAGYVREGDADPAEGGFAVADELHGMGIATTLLAHLAEAAEADGLAWLDAEVLPDNHKMIEVFRESGFAVRTRSGHGVIEVELPTALSPEARERFEARQ